jgi:hypothetical protein
MRKYFKCKFVQPKDFLGLDLHIPKPGLISLAMNTFTSKMIAALSIQDDHASWRCAHTWANRQEDR